MYQHKTITNSTYQYDEFMAQPVEGLIEQEMSTTYRKDGKIYKHIVTRRFSENDYNDSSTSKYIG